MKVHNYGNDYAQGMKFQKQETNDVANPTQSDSGKAGGEAAEVPEEKKAADSEKTAEVGEKEGLGKKEKKGSPKK